jgi:diketogulonate reductase-like aldo/keto reductase
LADGARQRHHSNPEQKTRRELEENIKAVDMHLSKEDLARLNEIFPARRCGRAAHERNV